MIKILLVLYLSFYSILGISQIVEIEKIQISADNFYIDKLENYYFQKNNSITKTDKNLDKIALYDNKSLGKVSYIDVSNPFMILFFYKDFNRLIYLDNFLSELRAPILLDDLQLYNIDVVCSSTQGGFWVYDNQNSQVVLINKDLDKMQQGVNLYSIIEDATATKIIESSNYIFIQFGSQQLIILDKFGNYYKNISNLNIRYFDVINDTLYIITDSELEIINIQTNNTSKYKLPDIKIDDFKISGGTLIFLSDNYLRKFKIQ